MTRQLRKELEWIPLRRCRRTGRIAIRRPWPWPRISSATWRGQDLPPGPLSIFYRLRKLARHRAAVFGTSVVTAAIVIGIAVSVVMKTTTITPVLASMLGVPTRSYTDAITLDLPNLPRDIPDLGRVTWCLPVTSATTGAIVTGVSYQIIVDNRGDASNFWCSDYEIGVSSDARGSTGHCYCLWAHLGGKTDGNLDNDEPDDSDIDLSGSTTVFNGQNPNQEWQFTAADTVHDHDGPVPLPGEGRVTRGRLTINYAIAVELRTWNRPSWSFSPSSMVEGKPDQHFEASCCIASFGVYSTPPFTVAFYASSDIAITPGDYLIGRQRISGLPGNSGPIPCVWSGASPLTSRRAGTTWAASSTWITKWPKPTKPTTPRT